MRKSGYNEVTCEECNLKESLSGRPSASACDRPLSAVHGSLMCIMANGGSALMMARALRREM